MTRPTIPLKRNSQPTMISTASVATGGMMTARSPARQGSRPLSAGTQPSRSAIEKPTIQTIDVRWVNRHDSPPSTNAPASLWDSAGSRTRDRIGGKWLFSGLSGAKIDRQQPALVRDADRRERSAVELQVVGLYTSKMNRCQTFATQRHSGRMIDPADEILAWVVWLGKAHARSSADTRIPGNARFRAQRCRVSITYVSSQSIRHRCSWLMKHGAAPFRGAWALPGGYIHPEEDADLEAAAQRVLGRRPALNAYVEQLARFGDARRDPRGWSARLRISP